MTKRGPDYQKAEAKRSLWTNDGFHEKKRYREHGRARCKDNQLIRAELYEADGNADAYLEYLRDIEADNAWLCYKYGICTSCNPQNEECDGGLLQPE